MVQQEQKKPTENRIIAVEQRKIIMLGKKASKQATATKTTAIVHVFV